MKGFERNGLILAVGSDTEEFAGGEGGDLTGWKGWVELEVWRWLVLTDDFSCRILPKRSVPLYLNINQVFGFGLDGCFS